MIASRECARSSRNASRISPSIESARRACIQASRVGVHYTVCRVNRLDVLWGGAAAAAQDAGAGVVPGAGLIGESPTMRVAPPNLRRRIVILAGIRVGQQRFAGVLAHPPQQRFDEFGTGAVHAEGGDL